MSGSPNLVYINVSPIEYGHVLLVPRVLDDLPQLADPATMLLALRFCQAADNPYFRLAFNSLGAYATINHLHFQVRGCLCAHWLSTCRPALAVHATAQPLSGDKWPHNVRIGFGVEMG